MSLAHAFRVARRAARVEDRSDVVGCDSMRIRRHRRATETADNVVVPINNPDDGADDIVVPINDRLMIRSCL